MIQRTGVQLADVTYEYINRKTPSTPQGHSAASCYRGNITSYLALKPMKNSPRKKLQTQTNVNFQRTQTPSAHARVFNSEKDLTILWKLSRPRRTI
jgi:hypothetical protein